MYVTRPLSIVKKNKIKTKFYFIFLLTNDPLTVFHAFLIKILYCRKDCTLSAPIFVIYISQKLFLKNLISCSHLIDQSQLYQKF